VPVSIDLVPVVTEAIETIRDQYPNATIETTSPDTATTRAVTEIELAVAELLENAVRHEPHGKPELSVTVRSSPETISVTIRDNCPPIPEVEFRILTGDWKMDDVYHTSGLGLWLVYWVADLSDGNIAFDRSETGNTITLTLPRDRT